AATLDFHLTTPGVAIGTVAYMSPEQSEGKEVGASSDLFSLGAVLYEMTTRNCPFSGHTVADLVEAIQHQQPTPIEKLNHATPHDLVKIANKTLQKDPLSRYQTAAAMRNDLRALSARLQKRATRRKAWVSALGLAALLVVALVVSFQIARVRTFVFG